MRFPKSIHKQIARLYPEEALLAAQVTESKGQVVCAGGAAPLEWLGDRLRQRVDPERLSPADYLPAHRPNKNLDPPVSKGAESKPFG